jgi:hypothetical protein
VAGRAADGDERERLEPARHPVSAAGEAARLAPRVAGNIEPDASRSERQDELSIDGDEDGEREDVGRDDDMPRGKLQGRGCLIFGSEVTGRMAPNFQEVRRPQVHRAQAVRGARGHVLLIEPRGILNTRHVRGPRTAANAEWI